ncbi:MAG: HAMP domain-containing sensor histidine kinase [Acidobacteriota bacterium]
MTLGRWTWRSGFDRGTWTVLGLLLVVVLVPTLGVLWFMGEAMRNERLAVGQKLRDVYSAQLLGLQGELEALWRRRTAALAVGDPDLAASERFAERVRGDLADAVVILAEDGSPAYPAPASIRVDGEGPGRDWRRAEEMERAGRFDDAANRFADIAGSAPSHHLAARALQAQARCLVRAGRVAEAVAVLTRELGQRRFVDARGPQGRLLAPSAALRALQLIGDDGDPEFRRVVEGLAERLRDYGEPALPASQRRFLMRRLAEAAPELPPFDTFPAENLAQRYVDSEASRPSDSALLPSGLPEVWHLAIEDGSLVALFHERRLRLDFETVLSNQPLPADVTVELLAPGESPDGPFQVSSPAGGVLRDWQLVLRPADPTLFATAARQRIHAYRLTGALVVVLLIVLTLLVARTVGRQLRLTRLKNDLLATVSHELKTPLASMRLLVDTLLGDGDDTRPDPERSREYLELIAAENARLSRLVDSFLTFSRMEQNRRTFDREPVAPEAVAEAAATASANRFEAAGFHFEVDIDSDLPDLVGDHDALVTVLLNLLDNAFKYSEDERDVRLSAFAEGGQVCFAVRDRGVGLSPRQAAKIFDRFYQADRSLSRRGGGCGLGLSIVRFVVDAHGGTIEVDSRVGEGSTFTLRLPADPTPAAPGGSP